MKARFLPFLLACASAVWAQTSSPSPNPTASASPTATPEPETPPVTLREQINGLRADDVAKALGAVKEKFLDSNQSGDEALQRATLEGLIRRLSPGVVLIDTSRSENKEEKTPFLAEILDAHIGYLRLGVLEPAIVSQIDAALSGFTTKKVDAVILDLRGTPPGGDFEVAAEIARRFCPKGKLLFSIQKPSAKQERLFASNRDPAFQGVVIVLTDSDTDGAAEALAGTLRQNAGAMIIGSDTTGGAAEFATIPLSGTMSLKVAIAQVILPEAGPIFPSGVKPDVAISLPHDVQQQIFVESKEKGVSQFVFESDRHRMNEASLVANQNPEIDSAQSVQREHGKIAPLRDTVLQRAVDLAVAINFYKAHKP